MEYQYQESFDSAMGTHRRIYNLDYMGMLFLSEFSDKNRRIIELLNTQWM